VLSLWTTTIPFSELGNAACTLATPGFAHALLSMHAGSLQARWLLSPGRTWAMLCLHLLGNNIQFHGFLSDSKDPDLT
jgi:hypothetical protein